MVARVLAPLHAPIVVLLIVIFALEAVLAPASALGQQAASPLPAPAPTTADPAEQQEPAAVPAEPAQPVELVEQRTIDSRTFQNADGSFTTEYSAAPIHYEAADGSLQPIEAVAVASDRPAIAYETKAAPVSVEFGTSSSLGDPLSVTSGEHRVTYRPIVVPNLPGSAAAADRAPLADGAQVTYADVYPSVDLRYMLLATGVKEDIVLTAPTTVSTFAWVIDAPGLTATLREDGSVTLGTPEEIVFEIPAPFMVDSAPEDDGDGVRTTEHVRYELLTLAGQTVLAVVADPAWLADPARVYPVYIDPTTTTTYLASADTFISSAYPSYSLNKQWNSSEGGYYELWNGYYDSTSGTNYAFVKTGFPSGKSVTSATFSVYVQHAYSGSTATGIYAGRLTSGFTESQTWNMTHPSYTALTSTTVADNQWANFNVTSAVQGWSEGTTTNHGLRIYQSSTSQSLWKRLRARENSTNAPKLVVTYTNPIATASSPTGGAWTKSSTMSWTYNANGSSFAQSKYQAQISTSSTDFSSTYLKADSGVVSSSSTSWAAPTTNLVNGTTYYWRVKVFDGHSWSAWSSVASFKRDAAAASFVSSAVADAVTAADPDYYDLGNGTFAVKIRGSDAHSGIKLTYLRLYNATDEMRVKHDWAVGGTHCDEFNTSSLVDATACSESYNSAGTREVTFTVAGLGSSTSFDIQYYFTDFAGNVVGYVDTGKNLIFDAVAPTGSISSPTAGASLSGTATISGTASDANFTRYELHYGAGSAPTSWTAIGTNPRTTAVTDGTLGSWDTAAVADGQYTIRLRVYDKARVSSGFTEVTRSVDVSNGAPTAVISNPTGDRLVDGIVEVSGTASASANFADYTLHYGVGCAPTTWLDIGVNPRTTPVTTDGLLGVWDTASLVGDHTIRLVVNRSDGPTSTDTVCVNLGSSLGLQPQHTTETWDLGGGDELAVNVATGNAVVSHPLVTLPYRGGSLPITLTYNSLSEENVGLGVGWQLNLQRRLLLNANGTVTFVDADGARHLFTNPQPSGTVTTYTRPASIYATLSRDDALPVEYTLTYRDGSVDRFDVAGSGGRLERSMDRHGNAIVVTYGAANEIAQAADPAGRTVDFTWDASGRLTQISDWAYIDANGIVQATATGSRRTYRFFHGTDGLLAGWSEPLNTAGSCPTAAPDPYLTCLSYAGEQLTAITETQTVTTLSSGTLASAARLITTQLTYADGRVASVTDAEQVAQATPARTTFTWADADSLTVARPTTTTAYELLLGDDTYGRARSVLRRLDTTTSIERRTSWDIDFPIEPASVTDNYGAALSTPARTVSYLYQAGSLGLVSKIVEPLDATTNRWTEHTYNANNDVTQTIVSQDGSASPRTVTRYCYAPESACPTTAMGVDLLRQIENFVAGGSYDEDTNVTVEYTYDEHGQRVSAQRHNCSAASPCVLNASDELTEGVDHRTDSFTYGAHGNLTAEVVNLVDGVVSGGYDLDPDPATQARTDLTTAHTYDSAGNRVSTAEPRRAIDAARGTTLAADDYVTRWTHDALNRRLSERTPTTPGLSVTQKTSTSTYDELGLVRSETDFGGLAAASESDRAGRALRTFEQPAGASGASVTAVTTYDADGRPLTAKDRRQAADASLGSTTYAYDALGRQTAATEAAGTAAEAVTATGYDALDRRTTYVVGGQDTDYSYDLGGRVTATNDGFTCTTETFDYRDRALTTAYGVDPATCTGTGQYTVTHTHDGLGRLVRDEQGALRPLDDTFDSVGNRLRSAPVTATDSGGTTTTTTQFDVNVLDQVVSETRTEDTTVRTSKTTFDPAGNAVDRCRWEAGATVGDCLSVGTSPWTNPPSHVASTTYDARNQRVELTDGATQQTTRYDANHNYQVSVAYVPTSDGYELQTIYDYDDQHRLTQILVTHCMVEGHVCVTPPGDVLGHVTYEYDANDNRTVVRESGSGWADALPGWFYCYDARNQLVARNTGTACTATGGDETYSYDDAGNRLSAMQDGVTRTFSYDAEGQYSGAVHDATGRITEWDNWRFLGYDGEGRLTEVCDLACSSGSQRYYFTYDADGRRTKIVEAGGGTSTTTELRYTAEGHISAEYVHTCDINGCTTPALTREYVTDQSGAIVKMVVPAGADAGTYLVSWNGHGDALNLVYVTKGSATLANSFTYDTWGQSGVTTHNGFGDLGFRFRYVGEQGVQDDSLLGLPLLLMGARHYAPTLGRFIQPDPARLEGNLYDYGANNPATNSDPSGYYWYRVRPRENLSMIAQRLMGNSRFAARLWHINAGVGIRRIAAHSCIWIPMRGSNYCKPPRPPRPAAKWQVNLRFLQPCDIPQWGAGWALVGGGFYQTSTGVMSRQSWRVMSGATTFIAGAHHVIGSYVNCRR